MKKIYTQEEQDASWKRYKIRKNLIPVVVVAIAGIYFLGKEGVKEYKRNQVQQKQELCIKKIINSPSIDSYVILTNKYKNMSFKSTAWTRDSITFDIGQVSNEDFSWKMIDIFNSCKNSTQKIIIAKSDLLESRCNEKESSGKNCPPIAIPDQGTPFRVMSAFNFNGLNLKINMGWNINETKEKKITLVNEGLSLKIKEIRSSNGEIKLVNKNLPIQLNSNSRISMIVPIEKRFLPNRNYNRYNPCLLYTSDAADE